MMLILIAMSCLASSTSRLCLWRIVRPQSLPYLLPLLYCFFSSAERELFDIAGAAFPVK